jgi:hypothetical protein
MQDWIRGAHFFFFGEDIPRQLAALAITNPSCTRQAAEDVNTSIHPFRARLAGRLAQCFNPDSPMPASKLDGDPYSDICIGRCKISCTF